MSTSTTPDPESLLNPTHDRIFHVSYDLELDREEHDIGTKGEGVRRVLAIILDECGYSTVCRFDDCKLTDETFVVQNVGIVDDPSNEPDQDLGEYFGDTVPRSNGHGDPPITYRDGDDPGMTTDELREFTQEHWGIGLVTTVTDDAVDRVLQHTS